MNLCWLHLGTAFVLCLAWLYILTFRPCVRKGRPVVLYPTVGPLFAVFLAHAGAGMIFGGKGSLPYIGIIVLGVALPVAVMRAGKRLFLTRFGVVEFDIDNRRCHYKDSLADVHLKPNASEDRDVLEIVIRHDDVSSIQLTRYRVNDRVIGMVIGLLPLVGVEAIERWASDQKGNFRLCNVLNLMMLVWHVAYRIQENGC